MEEDIVISIVEPPDDPDLHFAVFSSRIS